MGSSRTRSQAAYIASASSGTSPPRMTAGRVEADRTRSISSTSSTRGSLSQVCAEVSPSPAATPIARTTASAERSLRTRPSTRWEMNGSTIAIRASAASVLTAFAQAWRVRAVSRSEGSMRSSILPPEKPALARAAAE